jgi:replicative DNA helicase
MNIERVVFNNLVNHEEFARKTLPFLKTEYFHNRTDKVIFELIEEYVKQYNRVPSKEALLVDLTNIDTITDDQFQECKEVIDEIPVEKESSDYEWLIDKTEKFCQDKAIYNAIMQSIKIMDDKSGKSTKGAIPQLLSDALAVSFDNSIGHDYIDDTEARYAFYHQLEQRTPFDLDYFNKITKGGLPNKTLNIGLAGTGVGKSLFMCHCAANNLTDGKNVLYITLEMAEERIAERIDANLMNVTMDDLRELPHDVFIKKSDRVKSKTSGRLIIKEYPTGSAGAANFRHLLNELKIKKNFAPDMIYIDYLNICASSRLKQTGAIGSYQYIKAIAEELRGLAVEFDVPIMSATQTTRGGYDNSDIGLTDTSESFGLPATADFMFALISTEELKQLNQIMVKQLKNRYGDPEKFKRFVIGVDYSKMKLYDVEQSAQDDIVDDSPVFDKGQESRDKFNKDRFQGFK